jgi:hypothetical protein
MFVSQRDRRRAVRAVVTLVCVVAALAASAGSARAATVTAVSGSGTTAEDLDGTVIHLTVDAELDGSGVVSGRLSATFLFANHKPETVNARASCLLSFGSLTIVGGSTINETATADFPYSHFALILEDGGSASDRVGTNRFVGFPSDADPCAFTAQSAPFIVRAPLERGDIDFSG